MPNSLGLFYSYRLSLGLVKFYGISTIVGYLKSNPVLYVY